MMLELNEPLKNFFKNDFAKVMAVKGKVFRKTGDRETLCFKVNGHGYFIKKHFGVGWGEIFKNLLHFKLPIVSAKNEYQAMRLLEEKNIPTLIIEGFGLNLKNPASMQSFLITREADYTIGLKDICDAWPKNPPDFDFKYKIIKAMANVARDMHAVGMNHRDFYICHFLLDNIYFKTGEIKLYVFDLHRAQIRKEVPKRWLVKDLSALLFSALEYPMTKRDVLRFMKIYFKADLKSILKTHAAFLKEILKRTEKFCKGNQMLIKRLYHVID